jgi:hypothetical protein
MLIRREDINFANMSLEDIPEEVTVTYKGVPTLVKVHWTQHGTFFTVMPHDEPPFTIHREIVSNTILWLERAAPSDRAQVIGTQIIIPDDAY